MANKDQGKRNIYNSLKSLGLNDKAIKELSAMSPDERYNNVPSYAWKQNDNAYDAMLDLFDALDKLTSSKKAKKKKPTTSDADDAAWEKEWEPTIALWLKDDDTSSQDTQKPEATPSDATLEPLEQDIATWPQDDAWEEVSASEAEEIDKSFGKRESEEAITDAEFTLVPEQNGGTDTQAKDTEKSVSTTSATDHSGGDSPTMTEKAHALKEEGEDNNKNQDEKEKSSGFSLKSVFTLAAKTAITAGLTALAAPAIAPIVPLTVMFGFTAAGIVKDYTQSAKKRKVFGNTSRQTRLNW